MLTCEPLGIIGMAIRESRWDLQLINGMNSQQRRTSSQDYGSSSHSMMLRDDPSSRLLLTPWFTGPENRPLPEHRRRIAQPSRVRSTKSRLLRVKLTESFRHGECFVLADGGEVGHDGANH